MSGIEAVVQYVVEEQQGIRYIVPEGTVHQLEVIVGVEDVEYRNRLLVGDRVSAESYQLIKDRQGITQSAVCFLRHHVQCLFADGDTFFGSNRLQVRDDILHGDTVEIIDLTTTQDRRYHFMLLRRS